VPVAKRISLPQFFEYCVQNYLPVAIYRLPGNNAIKVIAQHNQVLTHFKGQNSASLSGFIFAPFKEDKNYDTVIIAPHIFTTADNLPALNFADKRVKDMLPEKMAGKIKEASRQEYIKYVKSIQREIKQGACKKIVAARVVKKKKPAQFDPLAFFEKLGKKYPGAFTSLVSTPQYGIWIGASPEILLNIERGKFKTFSLAGTRALSDKNADKAWGKKEQQEQEIVSDYILKSFKKVTKNTPQISGPETIDAANLQHLRTTFTYTGIAKSKWPAVINNLHPTPAVAGLPKKNSIDFIMTHEKADRAFYSGYLGPVNLEAQTNLFVNLRCMQVLKNKLALYVGCGITADSRPMDEWKESKMKSETLLSVLKV